MMADATETGILAEAYRRESRSFLHYVVESSPFVGAKDRPIWERLVALAQSEANLLDEIARWIEAHRQPLPYLGAYPTKFTNYNFANVRKLLPVLCDDQSHGIAEIELARNRQLGESRNIFERLLEVKKNHLVELEAMRGS